MTLSDVLLFYTRYGFFKPFRKSAYRKFRRRNRGKEFVVETQPGFKIKTIIGDNVDNTNYANRVWEHETSEIIKKLSKRCNTFVDVGCNIGYYSCLYSHCNPEGKIYAIDPNPEMIKRTRENLELNFCKEYKVFNFGVSNRSEELELKIAKSKHSSASFAYNPSRHSPDMVSRIKVQVKTLGDILSEEELESAFLKVDTEGYEFNVFSGLDPDNGLVFDYIIFEYNPKALEKAGVEPASLFNLNLFSYYLLYVINEDGSLTELKGESFCVSEELTVNCLLVKKDKAACLDFLP